VEITETTKKRTDFSKLISPGKSHNDTVKCISYGLRINRLIDILDRVAPPPEGLFKSFTRPESKPRIIVPRKETYQIFRDTEEILNSVEDKIINIDNQISGIDEKLSSLEGQKNQIKALKPIKFNLGYLGTTKHLVIKAGTVDSLEQLKAAIKDMKDVSFKAAEIDEKYSVVIVTHIKQKAELEGRLKGRFFTEFDISGLEGTPSEVLNKLDAEIKSLKKQKEQHLSVLEKYSKDWNKRLLIIDEELENERAKKDVYSNFGTTKNTKIITGWVLQKDQERLTRICNEVTNGHAVCHFKDPKPDDENVPVKLDNPKSLKPFEVLTTLFASPKYNEIDPTKLIAIPFIFYFGLMLGDAGYGFVILFLCLFGYFHLGKIRPVVKQASYIGIFMGISTVIFGFIMGSFFGDLIPRLIYRNPKIPMYKATIFGYHLPYDPIRMPVILLQVSLVIGVSYIFLSILVAAGHNLKYKKYKDFALGQFPWFILVPFGLALIFYAFFKFELGDTLYTISLLMVLVGIILLIVDKKGLFFFDITGYLGDTLSFARLLALGLATAGIAMTINIIAELMIPIHAAIVIVIVILLFFGHLINFVLQALGAGIHSLRLQYVEFFARCYEGGGSAFKPFQARRLTTKLEPRKKN
jgi:V/A-type H+-transporting ATPase subunit I